MSATVCAECDAPPATDDVARIVRAAIVPGHDGAAELFVEVAYPGGGRATVALAAEVTLATVDRAGLSDVSQLVGMPWHVIVGGAAGVKRFTEGN